MISAYFGIACIVNIDKTLIGPKNVLHLVLGDICIQNFLLGRFIGGYTVGHLVLRRRVSGAVKRNFRPYIQRYILPQMDILNKVIHILINALLRCYKPQFTQRNVT